MSQSSRLGYTQEEFLELLLSQGIVRPVKKRIGGKVYQVLAIDSKFMEGFKR